MNFQYSISKKEKMVVQEHIEKLGSNYFLLLIISFLPILFSFPLQREACLASAVRQGRLVRQLTDLIRQLIIFLILIC